MSVARGGTRPPGEMAACFATDVAPALVVPALSDFDEDHIAQLFRLRDEQVQVTRTERQTTDKRRRGAKRP